MAIDGPAFVPHLSGRRNLELSGRAGGRRWPPSALEESLELASLGQALQAKTKSYSMGMRQRLMLAQALMGAPDVLILDEPANGLDPGEVRALRVYIARLAERGVAVLVSSHLLAEIELLAAHAIDMREGAVVANGKLEDLVGVGSYEFEVDDTARAQDTLRAISGVDSAEIRDRRLLVTAPGRTVADLNQALVIAGVAVVAVRATRSLDEAFLGLAGAERCCALNWRHRFAGSGA